MTLPEAIRSKGDQLSRGLGSDREISEHICQFVRDEIPYALEEWNVGSEETLRLGKGMCAGKAQLAVALHKAAGISARFKVLSIIPEQGLLEFIARRLEEQTTSQGSAEHKARAIRAIRSLPSKRDHTIIQVCLGGQWKDVDVARDTGLDTGMRFMGAREERKVVSEAGPYDSLDRCYLLARFQPYYTLVWSSSHLTEWLKGRLKGIYSRLERKEGTRKRVK